MAASQDRVRKVPSDPTTTPVTSRATAGPNLPGCRVRAYGRPTQPLAGCARVGAALAEHLPLVPLSRVLRSQGVEEIPPATWCELFEDVAWSQGWYWHCPSSGSGGDRTWATRGSRWALVPTWSGQVRLAPHPRRGRRAAREPAGAVRTNQSVARTVGGRTHPSSWTIHCSPGTDSTKSSTLRRIGSRPPLQPGPGGVEPDTGEGHRSGTAPHTFRPHPGRPSCLG